MVKMLRLVRDCFERFEFWIKLDIVNIKYLFGKFNVCISEKIR